MNLLSNYVFTKNWYEDHKKNIIENKILNSLENVSKILEIGCYEGRSTCSFIEKVSEFRELEIHCIDAWGKIKDSSQIEHNFIHNINLAESNAKHKVHINIHKGNSDYLLAKLFSEGKQNYFDFIYIDASHQSPDVLCDAILAFRLLKINGIISFDDYLWNNSKIKSNNPLYCPKLGIDSFINSYWEKIKIFDTTPSYQIHIKKISN